MPGKMTSKTGKVRIQLTFDRPFFNAGGELSGRLEIQCSSSRSVMLADMIVELLGYEGARHVDTAHVNLMGFLCGSN
jgi:hypothetical protein